MLVSIPLRFSLPLTHRICYYLLHPFVSLSLNPSFTGVLIGRQQDSMEGDDIQMKPIAIPIPSFHTISTVAPKKNSF